MNIETILKKTLSHSLQREIELLEFIEECLKEIYPEKDDFIIAKNHFEEGISYFDACGCIQSLCCIKSRVETCRENRKKHALRTEKKDDDSDE